MWISILIVLAICCLALCRLWLYEPIPHGFSKPWKLRVQLAVFKVMIGVCRTLDTLGISPYGDTIQAIQNSLRPPLKPELQAAVDIQEANFDGVKVLVYRPKAATSKDRAKGLVHYHAGAWITGTARGHQILLSRLAAYQHIVSVSVTYRLAPKHPFPAPFQDSVVAAKYFLNHAADLGVDPERVGITGTSAGANLAAAVALRLRDDGFPVPLKLQLLVYPILQAVDFCLPSYQQNRRGPLLPAELMTWAWSQYITGHGRYNLDFLRNNHTTPGIKRFLQEAHFTHEDLPEEYRYPPYRKPTYDHGDDHIWNQVKETLFNPYLAPLMAEDLDGLPAAYIMTAQYDILRDEGILYAQRLKRAGVAVTHHNLSKGFHGTLDMPPGIFDETDEAFELYETFIKNNL